MSPRVPALAAAVLLLLPAQSRASPSYGLDWWYWDPSGNSAFLPQRVGGRPTGRVEGGDGALSGNQVSPPYAGDVAYPAEAARAVAGPTRASARSWGSRAWRGVRGSSSRACTCPAARRRPR